jgi:tetratricopeptide (TPR) repeat protein
MKKLLCILLLLIRFAASAQTTDQNLALQYYEQQEYDKAVSLLEKLYHKNPQSNLYYRYYYNCLLKLKDYETAEKMLKKNIKQHPNDLFYIVDYGQVLKQKGDLKNAELEFTRVIKMLAPNEQQITQVANAFLSHGEIDYAIKTYQTGQQLLRNIFLFSFPLAELYEKKGDMAKSISSYLDYAAGNPSHVQLIQNRLQSALLQTAVFELLKDELLSRIQHNNAPQVYSDLLIWAFIQRKDFRSAFIQTKALDKRYNENGWRVMNLARSALSEKQFDAAVEAFQYVIQKGKNNPNYLPARQELLQARKAKITESKNYTQADIYALNHEYSEFMKEFGINRNTIATLLEQAKLQAFYLHNIDSAIAITESVINLPVADKSTKGAAKLDLGDYYLMQGDMYEPVLLYTQVEKEFKDQPMGELARFKNAKLSYYKGDFEWAQAQLTVLKSATSELVANDALQLSVFIMDNFGLDTTTYPMQMFARAELLYYQNKTDAALRTLDSIDFIYPNHSLADDILFFKAKAYRDAKQDSIAAYYLEKLLVFHKEDILADDATFMLAELYETSLNNKEKARQLYEDILLNFKDSIYITEARKRYRRLRGDEL